MSHSQGREFSGAANEAQDTPPALQSFLTALDIGPLGTWCWDLRSHHLTWSSNLADFHGVPDGHAGGTFSMAPGDLPAANAAGPLAAIHNTLESR